MLSKVRLQNYPAIEFETAQQWAEFFDRTHAPTRVATPVDKPIAWRLHVAKVQHFKVAYGAHASDIDLEHLGSADGLHIHVPQSGRSELTIRGKSVWASTEQATLVDLAQPHRLTMPASPGYDAIAFNFPMRLVEEHFALLADRALPGTIEFEPGISLTSRSGKALASLADALVTGLEYDLLASAPVAVTNLSQALLSLLVQAGPHQFHDVLMAPVSSVTPRHVKRAIDYVRAHLDEPLTIAEIATASQTTVRTLQQGFKEFRGTTPLAYIRQLRLEAARAELSDPHGRASVAEIAFKWGFAHLGRFSADYRDAFGEVPSATARRARQDWEAAKG